MNVIDPWKVLIFARSPVKPQTTVINSEKTWSNPGVYAPPAKDPAESSAALSINPESDRKMEGERYRERERR